MTGAAPAACAAGGGRLGGALLGPVERDCDCCVLIGCTDDVTPGNEVAAVDDTATPDVYYNMVSTHSQKVVSYSPTKYHNTLALATTCHPVQQITKPQD